jgi:hypothetical protein
MPGFWPWTIDQSALTAGRKGDFNVRFAYLCQKNLCWQGINTIATRSGYSDAL